jgi:hypothetical protein
VSKKRFKKESKAPLVIDEKERRRVEEGEVNNNCEEGSRLLFASSTWTVKIYLDISNIIKYY